MIQDLIDAAVALADTLARENNALAALDMPRAVALLEEKTRAAAAFTNAQARIGDIALNQAERQRVAQQVGTRLRAMADDNKRLLERAMLVQTRVVGALAQAAPAAMARTPRYDSRGGMAGATLPAMALSTRA